MNQAAVSRTIPPAGLQVGNTLKAPLLQTDFACRQLAYVRSTDAMLDNFSPSLVKQMRPLRDYVLSKHINRGCAEHYVNTDVFTTAIADTDYDTARYFFQSFICELNEIFPPAARLVGIELNPGPPKSRIPTLGGKSHASDLSSVAFALGVEAAKSSIAKTQKKKKNITKTKKQNNGSMNIFANSSSALVSAPATSSLTMKTGGVRHKPFPLTGRCFAASLLTDASGVVSFVNNNGTATTNNIASVLPAAYGTGVSTMEFFPPVVRNIATSFTRYRVRKLDVTYVPLVGSNSTGNVCFGVNPEAQTTVGRITYGNAAMSSLTAVTPPWNTVTLRCISGDGLRNEWLYSDANYVSTEEGSLRQISPGTLFAAGSGLPIGTTVGQLWFEFDMEFDALSNESNFDFRKPDVTYSSSSSSTPLIPEKSEFDSDLGDSVYLPSSLLSKMGLQKAVEKP
jgi:hypothetical protein